MDTENLTQPLSNVQIRSWQQEEFMVRKLDPLKVDELMVFTLPQVNNEADRTSLQQITSQVVHENVDKIPHLSLPNARAATRDLGMLSASLARHEVGIDIVPELESSLVVLSKITQEVPRETVFHYGPLNPQDQRMRTFTGTDGERLFINSFVSGMDGLAGCIQNLLTARELSVTDPKFSDSMHNAAQSFESMVQAMINVRRNITPEFFTNELRPYFPPLTVDGITYMAPGGAQMPVILVDRAIWGIGGQQNEEYKHYYDDNWQYLPPGYRAVGEKIGVVSLVDQITSDVESQSNHLNGHREVVTESVGATREMLLVLHKFHAPHHKTAKENFQLRKDEAKGSGGYTPTILDTLGEQRMGAFKSVNSLYQQLKNHG